MPATDNATATDQINVQSGHCPVCGPDKSIQRITGGSNRCLECGLEWAIDLGTEATLEQDPNPYDRGERGYVAHVAGGGR